MFLTVDWDAFIRGNFDTGHDETPFFMDTVWLARVNLPFTLTGRERRFWTHVDTSAVAEVFVSESHLSALRVIDGDIMFLIDAHHDCWQLKNPWKPCCASWVTAWLSGDPSRRMWWVSDHHSDLPRHTLNEDIRHQVKAIGFRKFYKMRPPITKVHICRSSGWSPPWFDQKFINFVGQFPGEVKIINMDEGQTFDPMRRRWARSLNYTIKAIKQQQPGGYVITEISASDWPLGGVA